MIDKQLKVAVGYTKDTFDAIATCAAFVEGIRKNNDIPIIIRTHDDTHLIKQCDVVSQFGEWNGGRNKLRGDVHELAKKFKVRKLILDCGYLRNNRWEKKNIVDRYVGIGYDRFKGHGKYYNSNSLSDRWHKLNLELKPWRKTGDNILILGQTRFGSSTIHLDILRWYEKMIKKIRQYTDKPIRLLSHPNQKIFPTKAFNKDKRNKIIPAKADITKEFKNSWCTVAKTSGATIESLLNGIPVITNDDLCSSYEVAEHDIKNIMNPRMPDRKQWLYNLCYSQWNLEEIAEGLPWSHLRQYLYNE